MSRRRRRPRRSRREGVGYEVGYRKPPSSHQFRKGQSGNPKGRPRGSRNMAHVFKSILLTKMDLTERNGRVRTMTRAEAMLNNAVARAVSGEPKYVGLVLDLMDRFDVQVIEQQQPQKVTFEVCYVKPEFPPEQRESIEEAKRYVAMSEAREERRAAERRKAEVLPTRDPEQLRRVNRQPRVTWGR